MLVIATQSRNASHAVALHLLKGGGATPRVLGRQLPPPPPRGLRPTVSCQRYEPKEPTGAEGAQWGYVATLPTCGPFSDSAPRSEAVGIP